MFYASIPQGTTATVNANSLTTFPAEFSVTLGTVSTSTPTPGTPSSQIPGGIADPQVTLATVTVPSGGVAVDCFGSNSASAATWNTGAGWVVDYTTTATSFQLIMAHNTTAGSQQPSVTGQAFATVGQVLAPWSP
jgi:hypothetical protein